MIDADKLKAFLAEYRDLVHRHGLGIGPLSEEGVTGTGPWVKEVADPDAYVAEIEVPKDATSPQAP